MTTSPIRHAKFLLEKFREEECVEKHKGPYFGGNVPSTGLAMFMVMSKTCSVVDLYGFGESKSAAKDEEEEGEDDDPAAAYKYHYYKTSGNRAVGDDVHCFECERLINYTTKTLFRVLFAAEAKSKKVITRADAGN